MDIQVFMCDSAEALISILAELEGNSDILYSTGSSTGESGDLIRCRVRPPRDAAIRVGSYTDKFIVVTRRA